MASNSDIALQAAIHGNLGVLEMMASIVDLREAKDDRGRDALYLAAEKGHLEVCRFLVEESGLDVDSVSGEGRRPVHGAAAGGSESVLRYLLDRGGNPETRDAKDKTPLHDAAGEGHCEAVKLLLSKNVELDAISSLYGTPLHIAASKDQDQTLKLLLDRGADPNKAFCQYFTPLLMASCAGSLNCMKLLVKAHADVNFEAPIILMCAINHGITDNVKFLLEAGAHTNIPDEGGRIPTIWAAIHGIHFGGDPGMPYFMDSTPLHGAADEAPGHCEDARLMLSKDIISSCGAPLHMAAYRDQDETLKILLEHTADPNKAFLKYFSPLLMACRGRSLKCVKLLVEAGADVNFASPRGPTILLEAVNYGLIDIVKFLLEAGADPNIPDKDGRIPIERAAIHGQHDLVKLLFPRTNPIPNLPGSVDVIIRSMKSSFDAKASQDMELEDFAQRCCNGSFAKFFNLFGKTRVVGSKRKGLNVLCQAYRYVIDMIRVSKKSWGGKFEACHLRVTDGKFWIDLVPQLPVTPENTWADLNGLATCMVDYFVLTTVRSIYVRRLFDLCVDLHQGTARGMSEPGAFDRYLNFIYDHPSFGFSVERADLVKGIGMSLKSSSTDHINALVSCLSRASASSGEKGDWRNKVVNVAILKDVFLANVKDSATANMEITHFQSSPKDNFLYCRHALEHGAEKTLVKTGGGNSYKMYCTTCKQLVRTTYQRSLVSKAAAAPGSKYKWTPTKIQTGSSTNTNFSQTQPLSSPEQLDLLVGDIFDKFITDSICQIKLQPLLDKNPFISARLKVFARSLCVELNNGEEEDEAEGL